MVSPTFDCGLSLLLGVLMSVLLQENLYFQIWWWQMEGGNGGKRVLGESYSFLGPAKYVSFHSITIVITSTWHLNGREDDKDLTSNQKIFDIAKFLSETIKYMSSIRVMKHVIGYQCIPL